MLLLNATLTVEAGKSNSHAGQGWEQFTDAVVRMLDEQCDALVFLLWGSYAQKKGAHINKVYARWRSRTRRRRRADRRRGRSASTPSSRHRTRRRFRCTRASSDRAPFRSATRYCSSTAEHRSTGRC